MTTVLSTSRTTLDGPAVPALGLPRAVAVELHKLVDTRSARLVIAGGAVLMAAFAGGRALLPQSDTTLGLLATMACGPAGWLMLVLAVLLVSTEFSRRTIEGALLLDPRRGRLVLAKVLALLVADAVAVLAALVMGVGAALVAPLVTGTPISWQIDPARLALAAGSVVFISLAATAWGLLTRNAPAPIMVLLLWPTLALLVASASPVAERLLAWVNLDAVWTLADPTAGVVWRFLTSALVWIVLPAAVGLARLVKGDL
ncbi:hypothetical protein [Luteococcus peritonei]|uniref:ABC transporter permease n=1 Tax=Luteococcus peritonei TaxID=88874 RepID=A0ABW4S023_9ACTN